MISAVARWRQVGIQTPNFIAPPRSYLVERRPDRWQGGYNALPGRSTLTGPKSAPIRAGGTRHDPRAFQGSRQRPDPGLGGGAAPDGHGDLREAGGEHGRLGGSRGRADDARPSRRRDTRRVEHAARVRP